jgi:Family of unknown function (DUF6152)
MKNKVTIMFLMVVGLFTVSVPLFAHHGNAAYATGTKITVRGTVTEWFWANPHCFLKLDARDEKGEVQHWVVEASNPPDMTRQGWAKTSFKAGDEVVVSMMIPKNGAPGIGRFISGPNSIVLNGQPFPPGVPDSTQPAPKP